MSNPVSNSSARSLEVIRREYEAANEAYQRGWAQIRGIRPEELSDEAEARGYLEFLTRFDGLSRRVEALARELLAAQQEMERLAALAEPESSHAGNRR